MDMVKYIFSAVFGYLIGSLSPSALISKVKNKDIRECGTKNLGATNVTLNFGKGLGVFVMIFDMAKAFSSFELMQMLFEGNELVGIVAGGAAVLGHVFSIYHGFRGGKGLAPFGGLVLAYDARVFLFLLLTGLALMFIVNYAFILSFWGAFAFPFAVAIRGEDVLVLFVALVASAVVFVKNYSNMLKAKNGEHKTIREYIRKTKNE